MTEAEIFEEVTITEDLGPRLDVGTLPPGRAALFSTEEAWVNSLIQGAANSAPGMPPIHFNWIENDSVNAYAFRHRGKYFIGVNAGVVYLLHALFSRMLSDPRVLPQIGDVSKEDVSRVRPTPPPKSTETLRTSAFLPLVPNDPDRRLYYQYLQQTAMGFVVSHEITHIVHGHVAYRNDRLGLPLLRELGWNKGAPEPTLTRQTLEMDADMGAAANGALNVMWGVMNLARRPPAPFDHFYQDPAEAMFNYAFGICPFFRMFGDDALPALGADQITYPPWRVRQMITLATATSLISQRWNHELAVTCQQAMKVAMIQVEHAYSNITGEPLAMKGLQEAWDGTGWRHVQDKLIAHWRDELRGELIPFTHIELPDA